jgi:hypothetical protein
MRRIMCLQERVLVKTISQLIATVREFNRNLLTDEKKSKNPYRHGGRNAGIPSFNCLISSELTNKTRIKERKRI